MTLSTVTEVTGSEGNFTVTVKEQPRYVDMDRCIACAECSFVCPASVVDTFGGDTRKAVYIKYAQAVPLKYQIDPVACIRLNNPDKCGACAAACPADAINFEDREKKHRINVGAIILAPGFQPFDPAGTEIWGYGEYPNVITSMQLERILAASGPTAGQLVRPSDGEPVHKIAFLQCVGSRDRNTCSNEYCSSVCCMSAVKEAVVANEITPEIDAAIFFTDLRAHGKDCDKFFQRARDESGIRFIRSRVHGVEPHGTGELKIHYVNDQDRQVDEYFDLVVLSVGLETPESVRKLADRIGINLTENGVAATSSFMPVLSSKKGIFVCGSFAGPKDIPLSVVEGSAAASGAAENLAPVRHSATRDQTFPVERDCRGKEARIGVFICHCGSNIAGIIDIKRVAAYAAGLPSVVHVEDSLFACSPDTQELLTDRIREKGLNRIVIAACTPRTHESLFRKTLKSAGINEYLLDMANIRNQDSWVHRFDPEQATVKAKDLIRMAVARVTSQLPLLAQTVPITPAALVIGGGLAGMTSAVSLAEQGFTVYLVEQSGELGGYARLLGRTWNGEDIGLSLARLIEKVTENSNIRVLMYSRVTASRGHVGNFTTTVVDENGIEENIMHGAGIVAIGGKRSRPKQYGYGQLPRVVTALEFDKLYQFGDVRVKKGNSFVFIQCVGSRDSEHPYCSKVCCTHSVQSAIRMKHENPGREVYILYRDMRTYGQREALYTEARQLGVVFINYELHGKPEVSKNGDNTLQVEVWDHILHQPLRINADMVILATAILPNQEAKQLADLFKIPLDSDGFFQEAHAKIRPVDFSRQGMFVAGLAHYPKPVEESITQALAAAARAATLLAKQNISLSGIKAEVHPDKCDGCALCIDVCPYHAITLIEVTDEDKNKEPSLSIAINTTLCTGCGICQGTCPKRGVSVAGFTFEQINDQVTAALAGS